jgi:hypothetical protein
MQSNLHTTSKHMPRSIRVRLATKKPQTDQNAPTPAGQARSRTDRVAVGPWRGAFDSFKGGPPSPTVFMNSSGAVFSNLKGAPVTADMFEGDYQQGGSFDNRVAMSFPKAAGTKQRKLQMAWVSE